MNMTVGGLVKSEDKNEVVLSVDLYPQGLAMYESINWLAMFEGYSHQLSASWV